MRKIIRRIIFIMAVGIFLFAGYNVYKIYVEYAAAEDEYTELSKYATEISGNGTTEAHLQDSGSDGEEDYPVGTPGVDYPNMQIDFKSLISENKQFVGWLIVRSVGISYPVAQADDNDYYLHHTFDGTANSNGCVFLDANNSSELTDMNSFIYGHNMKNGTMFGSLKKFYKEDGIYEIDPYFYVYTKDYVYKYKIYSYYTVAPHSDTYSYLDTAAQYKKYEELVLGRSIKDCGVEVSTHAPTLTLSTCSGSGASKKRFVVHGIKTGQYRYN